MAEGRLRVAILYGVAEGKWHSRKLRRQLADAGYTVVGDPCKAEIILAHSGGCYVVPENTAQLVVYIGYTYWPGKPLWQSIRELLAYERSRQPLLKWLAEGVSHALYLANVGHTIRLARHWKYQQAVLVKQIAPSMLIIRNRHDSYGEPQALIQNAPKAATFVSLPGGHNHLWQNPTPYIEILRLYS